MQQRVFLDSGILIAAWRGIDSPSSEALNLMENADYQFLATLLVELETISYAVRNSMVDEVMFYKKYFNELFTDKLPISDDLVSKAIKLSESIPVKGIDAIHAASAIELKAEIFFTTEIDTKPIHKIPDLKVICCPTT